MSFAERQAMLNEIADLVETIRADTDDGRIRIACIAGSIRVTSSTYPSLSEHQKVYASMDFLRYLMYLAPELGHAAKYACCPDLMFPYDDYTSIMYSRLEIAKWKGEINDKVGSWWLNDKSAFLWTQKYYSKYPPPKEPLTHSPAKKTRPEDQATAAEVALPVAESRAS